MLKDKFHAKHYSPRGRINIRITELPGRIIGQIIPFSIEFRIFIIEISPICQVSNLNKEIGLIGFVNIEALVESHIEAPGFGEISVSPLTLSNDEAEPGEFIQLSADIEGENIGYIYIFSGFFDQASNSINLTESDFIDSGDTREVNGIYYPDWGEGEFTLEFDWEPIVFAINDGETNSSAI